MKHMLNKELRLALHPTVPLFWLLGAMLLIIAVCKPLRRSLHRKFFL